MSKVFVLENGKRPLVPIHPGGARRLLAAGKAAVYRRYPFTIILHATVEKPAPPPLRLKIDPGANTTGLAVVNDSSGEVVWAAELAHRGRAVKDALDKRRSVRRRRRARHTRYRQPRFCNRRRPRGWLPPSLRSRVTNILTWVRRLSALCPIVALSQELVRFDLQKMENPEIAGLEYQQGTLQGYELREYVLEKWQRTCAYCDVQGVPLQIEHIVAKANGGTDRVSNLTLACEPCNTRKGTQDLKGFLGHDPARLKRILEHTRKPLKDATAVNATRWSLLERLKETGLPVETGSGGRTKYNRVQRHLPKTHWLDAVCVGASTPEHVHVQRVVPLAIQATGRQSRQMCNMDEHGFPRGRAKGPSRVGGYHTGDLVRACVTKGKKVGTYVGRVAIKTDGYFKIRGAFGMVEGIHLRYCMPLHRNDGYSYRLSRAALPSPRAMPEVVRSQAEGGEGGSTSLPPLEGTPASSPWLKPGASAGGIG
jgi:5-methylcytosine-specific restriction endonuclease McrA